MNIYSSLRCINGVIIVRDTLNMFLLNKIVNRSKMSIIRTRIALISNDKLRGIAKPTFAK